LCYEAGVIGGSTTLALGSIILKVSVDCSYGRMRDRYSGQCPFSYRDGYLLREGTRLASAEEVLAKLDQLLRLVVATVTNKSAGQ
jgi:hypothetical protein